MAEIVWLLEEAILTIHQRQIAEHGGSDGLLGYGLLNGVNVQAAQVDKWLTFLRLAEGSITERELGEWIRSRMVEEN